MAEQLKIGFLASIIRTDEKLLLDEFEKRGIEIVKLDPRKLIFDLSKSSELNVGVVLDRCISYTQALNCTKILNEQGINTINTHKVIAVCGDKMQTSLALSKAGIRTPRVLIAVSPESALDAIDLIGYPCVIKPTLGSWGRLISKINDREAAEAIIEHKSTLGNTNHSVFYIQEYLDKVYKRDIRAFVVGGKTIAAIYRTSEHWITNTARGGQASNCEITEELDDICKRAAQTIGSNLVAIDLAETNQGYSVIEINRSFEFKNSITTTGVNIPEKIVDYVLEVANGEN